MSHVSDCSPRNGRRFTRSLLILHWHGLWSLEPATTALGSLWRLLPSCTGPCSGCTDKIPACKRLTALLLLVDGHTRVALHSKPLSPRALQMSTHQPRASMQALAIRNAMRDAVGVVALCEWCIAGGSSPPGARVALPAVLRRPRAAPTHLRAAAIRLNVVIWTNMDPSEGGRKSCP